MKLNPNGAADVLAIMIIGALLVLTAWGNAAAMLIFSAIGLLAGFIVPRLKGTSSLHHHLLAATIGATVAVAIASVFILSRIGSSGR